MIQQLRQFATVGIASTLAHVTLALVTREVFLFPAQVANLLGFCAAVGLSYLGHAYVTFDVTGNHTHHLPRFILVALVGLTTSSAITFLVYTKLDGSFALAMAIVAVIVPLSTFLGFKFWAFANVKKDIS